MTDDGLVPDDPTPQTETVREADPVPDAPPPDDGADGEMSAGLDPVTEEGTDR